MMSKKAMKVALTDTAKARIVSTAWGTGRQRDEVGGGLSQIGGCAWVAMKLVVEFTNSGNCC